jgi:hypothetical protein
LLTWTLEPIGAPYSMDDPAVILQHGLTQAVPVTSGAGGVISRAVAFDAEKVAAALGRIEDTEINEGRFAPTRLLPLGLRERCLCILIVDQIKGANGLRFKCKAYDLPAIDNRNLLPQSGQAPITKCCICDLRSV